MIKDYLSPHTGRQIIVINKLGDEYVVILERVCDNYCTVKFQWGSRLSIEYLDPEWDYKEL